MAATFGAPGILLFGFVDNAHASAAKHREDTKAADLLWKRRLRRGGSG